MGKEITMLPKVEIGPDGQARIVHLPVEDALIIETKPDFEKGAFTVRATYKLPK